MDETSHTTVQESLDFFVSRSGADAPFAAVIGDILEKTGHRVVLQQWDFTNRNFMERMDAALSSGARVIALLSNEYLGSEHCKAEWLSAIATDPLNTQSRLIVLRVNQCTPRGLLRALAYWDLVPIRDQVDLVRDVVLTAIKPGRHKGEGTGSAQYWRAARTVLHPEIRPTPNFTGRVTKLLEIGDALRPEDANTGTQVAAIYGLGGTGKSILAREYAYRAQERYAGVWWLNAARTPDSDLWEGVESGLVDLGSIFIRDLDQAKDRGKAARQTLEFIANGGFAKPWLLVYDNVDDVALLRQWAPVGNARVFVTSRLAAWGAGVAKIEINEWAEPEAVSYLLKESGRSDLTTANAEAIATSLGSLPLAMSHAAVYLRENENATAERYLAAITQHMGEAPESAEYDRAVFATFKQQVEQVEARAPGARAILSLAAFYAPNDIPEELFTQTAVHYPTALAQVAASPLTLEKAIGALIRFSLVDFVPDTRTFSIHRLVQAAARDGLADEASRWAQAALLAAFAVIPEPKFDTWQAWGRLISHVRVVASQVTADSCELALLLHKAGTYLQERATLADILPFFERALAIFDRLAKADPGNADWQRELSISQTKVGEVLVAQGKLPAALDSYQASLAIFDRLAKADPGNADRQHDLSVTQIEIGDVLLAQGKLPAALDSYQASLAIDDRLAKADLENAGWQRDLSVTQIKIGDVLLAQGKLPAALDSYQASLAISGRLAKADPENADPQRDLSAFHARIGNVLVAQGNLPAALHSYQASLAIGDRLAKADPGNADCQRELSAFQTKIGDVLLAQGKLPAALDSYRASLAISGRLAKADPKNSDWQYALSASHVRIGDVLVAQGNLPAALHSYQASLAIGDRLAKADPGNADWQRDLSVSHSKIGDVLFAQGTLPAALDSYQASFAISDRLAEADPGNADWQRDLSLFHGKVGNVLVAQGNLPAALGCYQASLAISDRLAKADPGNARWQRDLSVSQIKIGDVLVAQGNLPAALHSYQASLAIGDRLAKADPGNADWQRDLSVSHGNIGDVLFAQGTLPAALDSYQASFAISDRLAEADPGNAGWQRDLSVTQIKIGDVLFARRDLPAALNIYQVSLAISDRLAKQDPGNADWQRDLAMAHGRVGMVEAQQDDRDGSLKAFQDGRDILVRLKAQVPDNAKFPGDLAWFDSQIAALRT